uniref:Uncharacterized protein n=1 Tax=Spumella elongata TaxID=89044 RepID=A0A7S3H9A6_9STRA
MSEENRAELTRQAKICANEVSELERLLVEAQQGFASVNEQISLLEEQCGGISSVFNDCVERNDLLYEKIQEDRNNYEVTTIKAREQAERCQLDRVEHYAAQCGELHKSMLNNMNELQKGINCALVEIEKFEGAGDDVDFSKVSSLAVSIVNKLDHTQRGLVNTEGTIAQLEKSVKTARAGSTITGVPPPRPSITAPVGNSNNSNNGEENEADRRASVNFNARDLTLLRQKKKQEEAAAAKASAAQQGLALMQELDVSSAAEDSNALPPDWIEKTDKKSGRLYYVNEVTKARQWKRPVRDPISTQQNNNNNEEEDGEDTNALPVGWKELIDKKTGRAYYVNSETKEKQWRRPTNERVKSLRLAGSPTKAADQGSVMEQIKASNRLSRRLKAKVAPSYLVEGEGASLTARSAAKVAAARRSSMKLLESETVDEKYRNTVSYMCRVGGETKKGFLLKQGKFIGRWKRRHFVLTDDLLEYWDRVQDHALGKDGKTFFLSGACQTAYTSTQNCFCVSNPTDPDESNSWYLLADSESDMLDWMSAINAHIHMRYLAEWHITTDFWERGNVETTFWKMPASALKGVQRRPVGIRSLPINDGKRKWDQLFCTTVLCCSIVMP